MATIKKRINITLAPDMDRLLMNAARRDRVPQATKAASLLRIALEIEEDEAWDAIARGRNTKNARFISHEKAWA
ncbi:hypothetical protein L0Y46_02775 [bacterium]|nr:hypothetical protein [bacterium]MCI0680242.1 hypothetical protein [bacterium]